MKTITTITNSKYLEINEKKNQIEVDCDQCSDTSNDDNDMQNYFVTVLSCHYLVWLNFAFQTPIFLLMCLPMTL